MLRSTSVVGGMTLLSRILGLVRDIVYARLFGASFVMDAFFVAFRIPNIFRRFFAEGAFSQAFVPVFADYDHNRSRAEVELLVERTAGTLGLVLFGVTLVGVLAAPVLIAIFAPGFVTEAQGSESERYELAVAMLRLTFPYLLFISLTALGGAILNTYHRFGVPAFSPVLLNVVLITFAAWVAPAYERPGIALAAGVFAAGIVQLLCMLPFLARIRMLRWPRWGGADPGVRRIMKLMLPAIFGSSVAQVSILLDTLIASFLVTGSISWLYYSDRLMEFPLGVFGIALATVILPQLSRQHASRAPAEFSVTLDWALRLVLLIAAPAAVGLAVLSGPMLTTIFYGGEFTETDVHMARLSLIAYAFGLLGFTLVKVLAPGYFARQDTRTPVRIGLIALGANMSFNVLVVVPWVWLGYPAAHAGLAASTSLASFLNAGLLLRGLTRTGVLSLSGGWNRLLVQTGAACGVMAMLLLQVVPGEAAWLEAGVLERCTWLAGSIAVGVLCYAATLWATGLRLAALRVKTGGPTV